MKNVSGKSCRENKKYIYFMLSNLPRPPRNRAVYETMWKHIAQQDRPQVTEWSMRIAS